jgi:RimJ/RimL family protein N-acetyltransferase
MVRLRGAPAIIGNCGIFHSWLGLGDDFDDKPEAGWILRHDQEGRGIAREAMDAVLAWFEAEHGPQAIVCLIELGHARSIRLAGRLGFAPLRDAVLLDGAAVELFARPPGNKT